MEDLFSQLKYTPRNSSVLQLIREFESKHKDAFENVKSFWNQGIREFHRDMTGLKLDRRNLTISKGTSVNVKFLPDGEDMFIKLIDDNYPDLDFLEYSRLRELKESMIASKPYFESGDLNPEFKRLLTYCEDYFKKYDLDEMLVRLFKKMGDSRDIWGAYFYQDSHIEVYYVPLIIFTRIMRLQLEHAIVVVLAHELAHAYHNMGLDADGNSWKKMRSADIEIIEGLAQYFTCLFAEENQYHYPGVKAAYEAMLSCQSGPYIVHLPWINKFKREHIKHAFNVTRRTGVSDFHAFEDLLEKAKEQLK